MEDLARSQYASENVEAYLLCPRLQDDADELHRECDDDALLAQGRALVRLAFESARWIPVVPKLVVPRFHRTVGTVYVWARAPPRVVQTETKPLPTRLQEWDSPFADPADFFSLDDLQPFTSTDFACLLEPLSEQVSAVSLPTGTAGTQRRAASASPDRPSKRVKLDDSSLRRVIPYPHYYSAPYPQPPDLEPRRVEDGVNAESHNIPSYDRSAPISLFPHMPESIESHIASQYRRVAWIVPIRGSPPWEGATGADIALSGTPRSRSSEDVDINILWTHESVRTFWEFLVRELRMSMQLGRISVSYHAAASTSTFQSHMKPQNRTSQPSVDRAVPGSVGASSNLGVSASSLPPRSLFIDYIKVYCDAHQAMRLRSVLDAWAFKPDKPALVIEGNRSQSRKIRVLKCARFVLMDENAAGMLVS